VPLLAGLNATLGQRLGSAAAASVVPLAVALATALAAMIITGTAGALTRVPGQPPVLFLAGCLMVVYLLSTTLVAPRFGLGNAILFVLLGQPVSSAVSDDAPHRRINRARARGPAGGRRVWCGRRAG
jgi:transporter family-2 protein